MSEVRSLDCSHCNRHCGAAAGRLNYPVPRLDAVPSSTDTSCRQHAQQIGAVLAIYTDGVTESAGAGGEEYGETRLLRALEANRNRSRPLMDAVIADVQQFSIGEQADDLTLVIARVL